MTTRQRLVWLTVVQVMLAIMGLCTLLAIKQLYQSFVIVASFREALRDNIAGKEELRATSPRILLPWLGLPLVLIIGRNCAALFYRAGLKRRQIKRDIKAALLLGRLRQGHEEPFSLYLRSFSQEEKLKRKKGIWWYILLEGDLFGIDRETLDMVMSAEVNTSYPMIALGRPGERLGAGRLPSTDADWEALVLLLMKQAKIIFIVPGTSKGVIKEIEHLKNYFEKTIYIMPPPKYYYGDAEGAEQHWHETRQTLTPHNVSLPAYSKKGALFMLDEQGHVAKSSPFQALFGRNRVHELVAQVGEQPKNRQGRVGRWLVPILLSAFVVLTLSAIVWQYKFAQNTEYGRPNSPEVIGRYAKNGLSFSYYSNWKITEDYMAEGKVRSITVENEANGIFIIALFPLDSPITLREFAANVAKERPGNMGGTVSETQGFTIIRTIGGQSIQGIRHQFSVSLLGATVPNTQDFFHLKTDKANVVIMLYAPDEDWEKSERGFQVISDSLRFE